MSWGGERGAAELAGLLKGAPGSLYLALILFGEPSTTQQLRMASRYSSKTAREGLAKLEFLGLVQYDRSRHVWKLVPGAQLLQEMRLALNNHKVREVDRMAPRPGRGEDSLQDGREIVPSGVRKRAKEEEFPVYVYSTSSTRDDSEPEGGIEVVNSTERAGEKNSTLDSLSEEQRAVAQWLIRGGIGRNSPKMQQLLRMDLDLEYVKAHVLEKLAWQEGIEEEGRPFKTGLLIRKMEDGDEAPALRCEMCLKRPNAQGWCRCDYDAIVKR